MLCLAALVAPGVAAAHGRAATVALDYRLPLAHQVAGLRATILDGDRSLQVTVEPSTQVVVLGDLGEPMLRLDGGAWVNLASPTAQANRLITQTGTGWKRIGSGRSFAWHEHRLSPPPFAAGRYGRVADWSVPVEVNGHRDAISGSFWRVRKPALWPWLAGAALAAAAFAVVLKREPRYRIVATVGAGVVAGVAGLVAETVFALADSPSGRVSWVPVAVGILVAGIAGWLIVVGRGARRAYVAGTIGAGIAALCLSWLGVFFHGAVVSAFSPGFTRLACAVAFTAGLSSLAGAISTEAPA